MTRALLILLIGFVPLAQAESVLPECPKDQSLRRHNCFGTSTFASGDKYVGEWKENMMHGQGTYTMPDGTKYVGEWKDGKFHGQGTYTFPDGQKYVGEFKDGKEHGQGTHTFPDGQKYVGEYKDCKFHGQGTYTWPDGKRTGYFMNHDFVPNICSDMGLREGTSEHGQCVLKLMETVLAEDD